MIELVFRRGEYTKKCLYASRGKACPHLIVWGDPTCANTLLPPDRPRLSGRV